jgi:hypothetical protein
VTYPITNNTRQLWAALDDLLRFFRAIKISAAPYKTIVRRLGDIVNVVLNHFFAVLAAKVISAATAMDKLIG